MTKKFVAGLQKRKTLEGKIVSNAKLDRTHYSGEDCVEYFRVRSNDLRNQMEKHFSGLYEFRDNGNEHIYNLKLGTELPGIWNDVEVFSVHYMVDNKDIFRVTEVTPHIKDMKRKYGLK